MTEPTKEPIKFVRDFFRIRTRKDEHGVEIKVAQIGVRFLKHPSMGVVPISVPYPCTPADALAAIKAKPLTEQLETARRDEAAFDEIFSGGRNYEVEL